MSRFAAALIAWQRRHGRHDLPWQGTRDPYRVWLSEVMLQQTQVSTVIPYYRRFLERFPSVESLAAASLDEVLRLWSGLGYYARGRNLHAAARRIANEGFPSNAESIAMLPGVGRSTAAAIAVFAFGERAAILDGNVRRVLARCFGMTAERELWVLAERLLPRRGVRTYTQALMDLGALICTRSKPRCAHCPVRSDCVARGEGRIRDLPAPKRRKPLPVKEVTWLVLRRGRRVLLEKRPPVGIWGGLWAFLEGSHSPNLGFEVRRQQMLEPLEHGFTHYRLRIQPVLCEVGRAHALEGGTQRRWIDPACAGDLGVPAPVKRLLASLAL